jgi:O-antigen ligase
MFEYSESRFAASGLGSRASAVRFESSRDSETSLPFLLVLLFLAALYSQIALQVPGLQSAAPMNLIGGAAILAVMIQRLLQRRGFELVWPESYLLLAFAGGAALSCIGALWPRYALDNTIDLLKFLAVYFLILHTVDNERRLRMVFWTLVLGALFPAIGTLKNFFQGNLEEGRALWIGIFGNPNEVAYSLVVLIPVAAYLAGTSRPLARAWLWLVMGVYASAIYVTFSRGGMLGLLAVVALLGLRWRSAPVILLTVLLFAASVAFLAYGWTRGEGFSGLDSDLNFQQRLATFQGGYAMFLDHPLTGVGLGCSLIAWPLYAPSGLYTRGWLVIHNTFVQALSETGLIGFLAFTFLLGAAIRRTSRIAAQAPNGNLRIARLGSALAVSLWGLMVCGLSGGYVLTWFPYILLALVSAADKVVRMQAEGESVAETV